MCVLVSIAQKAIAKKVSSSRIVGLFKSILLSFEFYTLTFPEKDTFDFGTFLAELLVKNENDTIE